MGQKVDKLIAKVRRKIKPRGDQTKKGAAIAVLKSRGLIRQGKDGLVLTEKGRKTDV